MDPLLVINNSNIHPRLGINREGSIGVKSHKLITIIITVIFSFASVGHARQPVLKVVTTTTIFADLIKNVGGDRIEVISLVGFGVDPHHYEPTPLEAKALANADVFFYNGFGLESWAERLAANVGGAGLPSVQLSLGLTPITGVTFGHNHDHEEGDPHFWLDITNAMHYVEVIKDTFISLDPAGEEYYQSMAGAYSEKLAQLDEWFLQQIQSIPQDNRRLVTYHDGFSYMAERYGLEIVGFLVRNPDREPSAKDQAVLINEIKTQKIPAIFGEAQHNLKFVENIAKEAGVKVGILYNGALTPQTPTYIDMMKANALALVDGLK
jgi:manganese/iron transport system substrate-binding protein